MGEVSRRITENLELRREKQAIGTSDREEQVQENARFFDGIEGLASLSPANGIDGLYVGTTPRLGLKRVTYRYLETPVTDSPMTRAWM